MVRTGQGAWKETESHARGIEGTTHSACRMVSWESQRQLHAHHWLEKYLNHSCPVHLLDCFCRYYSVGSITNENHKAWIKEVFRTIYTFWIEGKSIFPADEKLSMTAKIVEDIVQPMLFFKDFPKVAQLGKSIRRGLYFLLRWCAKNWNYWSYDVFNFSKSSLSRNAGQ